MSYAIIGDKLMEYLILGQPFQMWFVFAIIILSFIAFALEKTSMEMTSILVILTLLVFFQVFPVLDKSGMNKLDVEHILAGLSNPAMISVLALLVLGQGIVRTGILDIFTRLFVNKFENNAYLAFVFILFLAMIVSGVLNNIPVVVIFIPIMQSMAHRFGLSISKFMMPLGFVAILGGMTTVMGSGTNLLVNSALKAEGLEEFSFFSFTIPGVVMAFSGFLFCAVILPIIMPKRDSGKTNGVKSNRQFLVELKPGVIEDFIGKEANMGMFTILPNMTVMSIFRNGVAFLPPFEDYKIEKNDVFIISISRLKLKEALLAHPWMVMAINQRVSYASTANSDPNVTTGDPIMLEAMIHPQSKLIGKHVGSLSLHEAPSTQIIGIKRRFGLGRINIKNMVLENGDVLLLRGQRADAENLRGHNDIIPLEWSAEDLPQKSGSWKAVIIFAMTILLSSTGILPIAIAASIGSTLMVMTKILTPSQALKALDVKVTLSIVAALAMGVGLKETGGAKWLAQQYLYFMGDLSPTLTLSMMFLIIAILSTLITTKTAAVLFTPAAVQIAFQYNEIYNYEIPWQPFAVAVVFAANCSFANPLGYKTNLLTMGPGNYRFADYIITGTSLTLFLWVIFSLFVPYYYGLKPIWDLI